jgi:hypothetical protein
VKRIILLVFLVLLLSFILCADVYIKSVERTKPYEMMGKKHGENVEIRETWLGKNQFALFGKEMSIIADYEKEKMFFLVNKTKEYFEFPTDVDMTKLQEILPPKVANIISTIKVTDAKVNLDAGTKKIANWECKASEFEMVFMIPALNMMPKFKIKVWATEEVPFDYKQYIDGMGEFYKRVLFSIIDIDEASSKELEKLDTVQGFQVAADVTLSLFGSEMIMEGQYLEVVEKSAPPGIYSPPKDFKKKTISIP